MTYVIEGLDPAPFAALGALSDDELRLRGSVRYKVDAKPGFPCRITLDDAAVGERVLLLNHVSREGPTPYRASHAIFVRENAPAAARHVDAVPPALASRPLSLRGFDADGMMVDALLVGTGEADAGIRALFKQDAICEIDAHNAVRGCFAARVRRA